VHKNRTFRLNNLGFAFFFLLLAYLDWVNITLVCIAGIKRKLTLRRILKKFSLEMKKAIIFAPRK
jgi:hypothetical protein